MLTSLVAVNAAWIVGVVVPGCCFDARARIAAAMAGGATGHVVFTTGGATFSSLFAAFLASVLLACATAYVVERTGAFAGRLRAARRVPRETLDAA